MRKFDFLKPDLQLIAKNGKVFPCHRISLATKSAEFFKLLKQFKDFEEINLPNTDSKAIIELLRFCYTNEITDINEGLKIASEFKLDELLCICEKKILDAINVENVSEKLIQHQALDLKNKLIKFINDNFDQVKITNGWQHLVAHYLDLVNEVIEARQ